tara:strand:- start:216 stop:428 length:213 start_codon:yes stop_codon:yes gene_type:complete
MNLDKFKEIIDVSTHVDVIGDYEIRRYKSGGGYIIIDALGDFIVLTTESVEEVCGVIFSDLMETKTILVN